jgi:uncharacterized flavoprotein (TIGR03862 family)
MKTADGIDVATDAVDDLDLIDTIDVAVIGAGPAGLFASELLLAKGFRVALFDRMPSAGRKFLVAGSHGGLNITNAASPSDFAARYGDERELFARLLADFSPDDLKRWLSGFGVLTHTGSGGKVFPEDASAGEILSRWMTRLKSWETFRFFPGHTLIGFGGDSDHSGNSANSANSANSGDCDHSCNGANSRRGVLRFQTASGVISISPRAAIFALGGASWPSTGSDGKWKGLFRESGIEVSEFLPANCGFEADWNEALAQKCAYVPLKNLSMSVVDKNGSEKKIRGELMLTPWGMEGGVVYGLGAAIRDEIFRSGSCTAYLDLFPDLGEDTVLKKLSPGPGKESLVNFFRKKLSLSGAAFSLLREGAGSIGDYAAVLRDPAFAAALAKRLPVILYRPRPIEEAISSAGGVSLTCVDDALMLKDFPGFFCAGEMLDWESPTGGFLMQGCFSTAYRAAFAAAEYLDRVARTE